MKRVLLVLATVLLVLGAIGAVTHVVEAGAEAPISTTSVPVECIEMSPEKATSPDATCRDYLFQIHCQFSRMSSGYVPEAWEDWCRQRSNLELGNQPAVPRCDLTLAGQKSVVGERCRNYLAATQCLNGSSSQADMQDFCAKVAPSAGPDPRPLQCTPETAQQRSPEGNRCWAQLEKKYCTNFNGNTGAQDLNEFCEGVKAGKKPPAVDAACNRGLAEQNSDAGRACKDQLYTTECQTLNKLPPDVEKFCKTVSDERKAQKEAEEKKKKEEAPPPEQPGGSDKDKGAQPATGAPNVLLQLGHEPICDGKEKLNPEIERACKLTGSAMHDYPFANYGIDNNVSVEVLDENFWSGETPIMSLFQWLLVGVWQALIWLVKMALLVLQWAFAVDPLARAQDKVSGSVMALFNLFGPEWRLTALAVLGVWGFWNGLVRRRFMQTLSGLLLSLLLMIGAMWIVYDPKGTVGQVAHYANESAAAVLSATSSGELRRPKQGMAEGQHKLFDQLVVGPWCALQFGGQRACNEPTSDPKITRRDLWLSLPANSSAREVLYAATKDGPEAAQSKVDKNYLGDFVDALGDGLCMYTGGLSGTCPEDDDDVMKTKTQEEREDNPEKTKRFEEAKAKASALIKKDPGAVVLQGPEGVFTRAGLLAVIAIGMLGAVAFLLAIGVRLVVAGVILLLLILLAPVMLIVAAFGEEGRRRFITWVRMLLGAAVAKLVYSVLLGLVLLVVGILIDIGGEEQDWLGGWLLVSAFFWIAVLQMNRVLALLAPDPASEQSNGLGAGAALFMGQRLVSQTLRGAWQGATFLPRKAAPRAARAIRRERAVQREGTESAIRGRADDELDKRAMAASLRDKRETGTRAEKTVKRSDSARKRIRDIDEKLEREPPPKQRAKLERQRQDAVSFLRRQEPDERWARWQMQSNRQHSEEPSEGELRSRRSQRQRDVRRWSDDADSWSSESNRRWAGITDADWNRASEAAKRGDQEPMKALRQRSEIALKRDRELLARSDDSAPHSRQTRQEATREWRDHRPPGRSDSDRPPFTRHDTEFATREREGRRSARRRGRENLRRRW